MKKIKSLVSNHALIFGLIITCLFIILVIASSVLGNQFPGEPYGQYIGGTIGRLISIGILLLLVSRLGWLRSAGFTSLGNPQAWLISVLMLVYWIPVSAFTVAGNLDFNLSNPALLGLLILFFLTIGFMEEIAFRGLIQYGLLNVWGNKKSGMLKSILVSSMFFAGMHVIYLLSGTSLQAMPFQIIETFFLGIILGALVLRSRSIYPAVFFHWLVNLAAFLNLSANSFEGIPPASWLLLALLMFPLAVVGIVLVRGSANRPVVPDAA